jgi:hypothetical protein
MAKQSLGFSTPMMNTSTYVRQHLMLYPQWIRRQTCWSKLCCRCFTF